MLVLARAHEPGLNTSKALTERHALVFFDHREHEWQRAECLWFRFLWDFFPRCMGPVMLLSATPIRREASFLQILMAARGLTPVFSASPLG